MRVTELDQPSRRLLERLRSLSRGRERAERGEFVAEGVKLVGDMLPSFACRLLVVSHSRWQMMQERLTNLGGRMPEEVLLLPDSYPFGRLSGQKTPQGVLAIFALPQERRQEALAMEDLTLLLDGVQDPGNMGTILRTADWFGLRYVWLTSGCADPFSPKVVQSSQGALSRVSPIKIERLEDVLPHYRGQIYGTFLDGEEIYSTTLPTRGVRAMLVMGNEGQGISPEVEAWVDRHLYIPPYLGRDATGSESLNVAIATAICLSHMR